MVTVFTVESYTWLQQDPGDASNILLARISLQLSAFTPGSKFFNSSSPPLTFAEVESSFFPVSYAVFVDTLWVLSLTLSLLSALFAIAVQQWLRQLRLPTDISARKAIQLLEIRFDGLQTWQISSIISLLPLLLQIAVILFLVGLFLLLQALNTAVALAFSIVAVIGLLVFLVTVFIPLVAIQCPYKSPIIPTTAILLQTTSYPLALAITPIILGLNALLQKLVKSSISQNSYSSRGIVYASYSDAASRSTCPLAVVRPAGRNFFVLVKLTIESFCNDSLIPYIKSFGRHMFVDIGKFRLSREYRYIDSQDGDNLELASLAASLFAAPIKLFTNVLQCLRSFPSEVQREIYKRTVLHGVNAITPDASFKWIDIIDLEESRRIPTMKTFVRKMLTYRHHRLLWWLLQQRDWTQDGEVSIHDSRLLTQFHDLDKGTNVVTAKHYIKYLLRICHNQTVPKSYGTHQGWEPVPTCLALDVIRSSQYSLDNHGMSFLGVLCLSVVPDSAFSDV